MDARLSLYTYNARTSDSAPSKENIRAPFLHKLKPEFLVSVHGSYLPTQGVALP